jgi:hypothetical protein
MASLAPENCLDHSAFATLIRDPILQALAETFIRAVPVPETLSVQHQLSTAEGIPAILRCRTSALGGHIAVYHGCCFETGIPFNSCRSRCYPKFQTHTRQRWIEARQRNLLPTNYFELLAESHATDEPHNQHNHNNCSYQTQT